MAQPRLEVINITKSFPGVKALSEVSLSLSEGEIVSLVGENGAGKSTLINVITGQILPDAGEIMIDGAAVKISNPTDAMSYGVGLVPQELNLIPDLSVAENIYMGVRKVKPGIIPRIDWKTIRKDAEKILQSLNANIDVTRSVGDMSVADQQMVQIARALSLGARILIFDEPTACLTVKETEKLLGLIMRFKEEGKSIIYVSHHLEEVMQISDRVVILRDGEHVGTYATAELTIDTMISGMIGRQVERQERERRMINMDEVVLKVDHLCRGREYQDISFEVHRGEIFGIAGLIGAGRTELVTTIFGDRQADSGTIWYEGKEISYKSPREAIQNGIGLVPEERRKLSILPTMNIRENLTIASLKKIFRFPVISAPAENELVDTYAGQVHVKMASPETLLVKLSGGNQQKVIIARWLAVGCRMLIIDEPTRGIDILAKREIHSLIRKCADSGVTVLAVSSEMQELIDLCDRILVMHEGRQKGLLDNVDLTQEQILNRALA